MTELPLQLRVWDAPSVVDSRRVLGRLWVVAAAGLAGLGWFGGSRILAVIGIVGVAVPTAIAVPEATLGLFLFAGGIKGAPWLSGLPFDLTLAAGAGVCAAILARVKRFGIGPAALAPGSVLAACITALVCLTILWSPDPAAGLNKALRFQFLTMLAFAAPLLLIRTRDSMARLMMTVVGFALIISLTSAATNDLSAPRVAAGGTEIELGIYSGFGVVAVVGYLLLIGHSQRRLVWLVPALLLGATVLAAGSRGALVSVSLSLLFVWWHIARSGPARLVGLGAAIALILILATGAGGVAGPAATRYRQHLFTTNASAILGDRAPLITDGWRFTVEHPFGVGTAGFSALTGGLQYPHDIILELGAEQGLIGVALFLALLVIAWRSRRYIPLGRRSAEATLTGGLIVLFFVESLFSNDINGDRLLWFALGLTLAARRFSVSSGSEAMVYGPGRTPLDWR